MFAKERHQRIVTKINTTGRVLVKDLAVEFDVSEDCIRKDLTILQNQNLLEKTYGGAIKINTNRHLHSSYQRKNVFDNQRENIAQKAVKMIEENDTVFLDISLSNVAVARKLIELDVRFTIITNMIEILNILVSSHNINLIFIGGQINEDRDGFNGTLAMGIINKFVIDKSFIGLTGIDVFLNQVSTYRIDDGIFKKAVIDRSKKSYLLIESRKFNEYGNFVFTDLTSITGIVTSEKPQENILSQLETLDVKVI